MRVGMESITKALAQIDTAAAGEPAFRLVVTGTEPTLTTDDGTVVVTLAVLAP